MQNYVDHNDEIEQQVEEPEAHHFCKLTFGQFFTLMVLEIITLCFVFYLGARYGNEYLKLDVVTESRREPVSIVSEGAGVVRSEAVEKRSAGFADMSDDELREMARKTMSGGDKVDLKQRVEEILARQQGPSTPPIGEPAYRDEEFPEEAAVNYGLPSPVQTPPAELSPPTADQASQGVVKVKSTGGANFSVQVGSYPDVKEASYRVEEWKAKGYPAYMMIANLGDKGQWYRVRIGAFAGKDEAGSYLEQLSEKESISDAFVVKNEQ